MIFCPPVLEDIWLQVLDISPGEPLGILYTQGYREEGGRGVFNSICYYQHAVKYSFKFICSVIKVISEMGTEYLKSTKYQNTKIRSKYFQIV